MNETLLKKSSFTTETYTEFFTENNKIVIELKSRTNTLGAHLGAALEVFWVHSSPKKRRGWWALRLDPPHLRHVPCRLKYCKLIQWGFVP